MTEAQRIVIPSAAEDAMRQHCEEEYPYEACGAILGRGDGAREPWRVTAVAAAPNDHEDDRRVRYLVSPAFQLDAERRARETGEDVIGWYHSHPDDRARPSEYDRSHAWAGYVYAILSVAAGRSADLNAFTLDDQGGIFVGVVVGEHSAEQPET